MADKLECIFEELHKKRMQSKVDGILPERTTLDDEDLEYINAMRKANGLTDRVTAEDKAGILDAMKLHGVNTVEELVAAEGIIYNTWDVDESRSKQEDRIKKAIDEGKAEQIARTKELRELDKMLKEWRRATPTAKPTIIPEGEPNGVIPIVIEYQGRQYKLID